MGERTLQNPYRCSDNACVLLMPDAPRGTGTNGGCKCLSDIRPHGTRHRVRSGVRWLRERLIGALEPGP